MSSITTAAEAPAAELARLLVVRLDELTDELVGRILTGEHAYAETSLITEAQLRDIVRDNLASVLRQLSGEPDPELSAPRATGRLKADYGFPLAALLHAYRLAGRLVWDELRAACVDRPELLPDLGGDVWRIIDDYSTAAAEEYGRALADREGRDAELRRAELRALLDGVLEPGRLRSAAATLQVPLAGTFLVVSAEGGGALPGIEARLREHGITSHWLSETHTRIGLLHLPGAHALPTARGVLRREAAGRVGLSTVVDGPLDARDALREAELARIGLEPGTSTVGEYGQAALPLVLAHSPDAARELRDSVLGGVLALPDADAAALIDTLRVWFESGGSLAATAEKLHYHRNTINHRLRRIEQLTGRDRSDPRAAAELYLAVLADRLFAGERNDS